MQLAKKGKFIADPSQGSCHASNAVARVRERWAQAVTQFIRCALTDGSWLKRIGYMFAK